MRIINSSTGVDIFNQGERATGSIVGSICIIVGYDNRCAINSQAGCVGIQYGNVQIGDKWSRRCLESKRIIENNY